MSKTTDTGIKDPVLSLDLKVNLLIPKAFTQADTHYHHHRVESANPLRK